jgi:ABC-type antimicrobial peptide transport system permease subunit
VAMVNEAFVRRFFPTSSPLGHHIQLSQTYEIVGVVRDALFHDARDQMIPFVFIAMLQERSQQALDCEMTVRARGDAAGLAPLVRQTITQADGRLSVTHASTLRAQVLETFGPERVAAGFVATFAGLALLLAAIGLYGVVSYSVTKRTNEIGVRLALGAGRADVIWLFGRETLTRLTVGLVIGFVLTQAARQLLATWLFGVTTRDLRSLIAAALALGIVVTLATLRPTLRALRVDPVTALRTE